MCTLIAGFLYDVEFQATADKLEFKDVGRHPVCLLKIAICQVPTGAGKYRNFSLLAIFDSAIAVLHRAYHSWIVLQNQFNMFCYQDAIIHKGFVFATTQSGTVYVWNHVK
jgi:hypothetical protein